MGHLMYVLLACTFIGTYGFEVVRKENEWCWFPWAVFGNNDYKVCGLCDACDTTTNYISKECEEFQNRVCTPCSVCGPGDRLLENCTTYKNTVCRGVCKVCTSEEYRTAYCNDTYAGECKQCTECQAYQYETTACNGTQNRQCTNCNCLPGNYLTGKCNATAVCAPCRGACAGNEYELVPCTILTNRVCSPCQTNYYCNGLTQTPCTVCGEESWTANCNTTYEGECKNCSVCKSNEYETVACNWNQNRKCADCPCSPGTYLPGQCNASAVCIPCRGVCANNEYELVPCTNVTNRVCSPCSAHHYCNGVTQTPCTVCGANKLRVSACNSMQNSVCSACAPGKYSPHPDATACVACSVGVAS